MHISRNLLTAKLVAFSLLLALTVSTLAQTAPPKAEKREVKDTYFGQTISDSYRWMENLKSDETQKWIRAQADYSRAYLDKLPMRKDILKRLNELSEVGTLVNGIRQRGNLYFYNRRASNENDFRIYVREGLDGSERLLVDPDKIANDGKRRSIGSFNVSPDGRYLSYLSSVGGSGIIGELRGVETATGKDTGDVIDRASFAPSGWLPDGKSFLYIRLQKLAPNSPPSETYQKSRVYLHVLGTNANADKAVFGYEVNPKVKIEATQHPNVVIPLGSKYAFATVSANEQNLEFYVAPLDALNQIPIAWRQIANFDDEVSRFNVRGDDLYLMTYKNTPRYKVIRINLKNPDVRQADVVFPASEAVVESLWTARDALYVQTLDGGTRKIYRVDYKTRQAEPIKLPYQGSASIVGSYPDMDGIYFDVVSWTKSTANFLYNPKTKSATDTRLVPPIQIDMSGYEVVNAKAKSHDGVGVPIISVCKSSRQTRRRAKRIRKAASICTF